MGLLDLSLLLACLAGSVWAADCPPDCYCDDVTATTTCIGDRRLGYLPDLRGGGEGVRRLEIRDYVLPDLSLDEEAVGLLFCTVEELALAFNQIREITFLGDGAGRRNGTVRLLDLSTNNLSRFEGWPELGRLRVLDLSHNRIRSLGGLEWVPGLESLNLRSNAIEELDEDIFQASKSLHYINLEENRLTKVSPNLFSNLPALAHLIISSNPLNLEPGFLFNSRTQFIDVSGCGLGAVPPSLTTTVRDLRLNNNKLGGIGEADFESYPNLGLLVLDENQIEWVEEDALGRLEFLTGLWLNGNRLSRIPQFLPASLKSLQLEENRITGLNQTDFLPLANLETLNLHGNRLTSLEPFALSPLSRLRTLILRANGIEAVYTESFRNLSSLEILDLAQNPLKVIVVGALGHVPNLNVLHLARLFEQELEFDVSVFRGLGGLQVLDLSDSPTLATKLVSLQGLEGLTSLRELNLDRTGLADPAALCEQLIGLRMLKVIKGAELGFSRNGTAGSTTYTLARLCGNETGDREPRPLPPPRSTTESQKVSLTLTSSSPREGNSTRSGQGTAVPPRITRNKMKDETPSTSTTSPSTSSYFGETNEEAVGGGSRDQDEEGPERGSIDGFPADLSGGRVSNNPVPPQAKARLHSLPQKMLLSASADPESSRPSNGNLILKTILVSAGSCMLSVLVLLAVGLVFFRINGGRFVRRRRTVEPKPSSYRRLEEKTELELGISNKMYYEDGEVFHIS